MTAVNRFLYRALRRLSAWAFSLAHGLQWLSLKAYDKSNYGAHRANKTRQKKYLTNGIGYVYDYLVGKIQQIKAERTK
jgi:hypothetical protein